jgi:hypothetical protein
MTALELVTVLCAVAALAAAVVLTLLAARVHRAAGQLAEAVRAFDATATPAVEELRAAARRAVDEVDRLDDLLDVAGSIGQRVDTATEVTYRALTSPVIKGVALASGTRRAATRLRGGRAADADRQPERAVSSTTSKTVTDATAARRSRWHRGARTR